MMNKWLIAVIVIVITLVVGYLAIFQWVVPNAARAFIPSRWQNVPLGEKKSMVHEYLGAPVNIHNGREHWEQRIGPAKKYLLDVEYRVDTLSAGYEVRYAVKILGFTHLSLVKSGYLKH
jgi:hypothetical protein